MVAFRSDSPHEPRQQPGNRQCADLFVGALGLYFAACDFLKSIDDVIAAIGVQGSRLELRELWSVRQGAERVQTFLHAQLIGMYRSMNVNVRAMFQSQINLE